MRLAMALDMPKLKSSKNVYGRSIIAFDRPDPFVAFGNGLDIDAFHMTIGHCHIELIAVRGINIFGLGVIGVAPELH